MRSLSPQEGMVGLALCAFDADGDQDMEEWGMLSERLLALPEFEALSDADLREMLPALAERRAAATAAFVRDCVAAIPPDRRRAAFAVATAVVAADARVAANERGFLDYLASELGLGTAKR